MDSRFARCAALSPEYDATPAPPLPEAPWARACCSGASSATMAATATNTHQNLVLFIYCPCR
jgi:hypothetical protein